MPVYRSQMIFGLDEQGWTETWFQGANSIDLALAGLKNLATLRVPLLGAQTRIKQVRVSDDEIIGDSLAELAPANPVNILNSDQPALCVLVRVEAGPLYRRSMWLRGLPDEWITLAAAAAKPAGTFVPLPVPLTKALALFGKRLTDDLWYLRVGKKTEGGAFPGNKITSVGTSGAPRFNCVLTLANNTLAAPGERIVIRKAKGADKKKWNHSRLVVTKPAANQVEIDLKYADYTTFDLDTLGVLLTRIIGYQRITSLTPIRVAIRQTGRALLIPRGRTRYPMCPVTP